MYARNQTITRQTSDSNVLCCSVGCQYHNEGTEKPQNVQLRRVIDKELVVET
jgi:hypothetical protein